MVSARRLVPGDVIRIPGSLQVKYYPRVYSTKNRFDSASGFFRGLWDSEVPSTDANLSPYGHRVFTTLHATWDGSWLVVGRRADLLMHFDNDPEIYHAKRHNLKNDAVGEFCAVERASNGLRRIDANEAARVGLLDRSYRVALLPREVPSKLAKWNCHESKNVINPSSTDVKVLSFRQHPSAMARAV
jgi:hypothetical protein